MQIACYKGTSKISRAIRFLTRSEYSHAAIILRDGFVIEAWDSGVRVVRNLSEQHTPGTIVDVFNFREPLTDAEEQNAENFLTEELRTPYDWKGVLRFVTRNPGSNDEKWFCSELAFAAARAGGRLLFNQTEPWEVPPGWLPRSPLLNFAYQTRTQ